MQPEKWILILTVALAGGGPQATSVPAKMTTMIVQMSGTDVPPDSFAAQPKIYIRASNQYCRIDEAPDTKNGIHGRMIVDEPDVWVVNLADNTAKHIIDPGPTFNCRLPIFATDQETAKSKIGELEFGREIEFFHTNGAQVVDGPKLQFKAEYYKLAIGDAVLTLVERVDIHAPILIALIRGNNLLQARYLLWDDQTPFKSDVFARPTGVTMEGAK